MRNERKRADKITQKQHVRNEKKQTQSLVVGYTNAHGVDDMSGERDHVHDNTDTDNHCHHHRDAARRRWRHAHMHWMWRHWWRKGRRIAAWCGGQAVGVATSQCDYDASVEVDQGDGGQDVLNADEQDNGIDHFVQIVVE